MCSFRQPRKIQRTGRRGQAAAVKAVLHRADTGGNSANRRITGIETEGGTDAGGIAGRAGRDRRGGGRLIDGLDLTRERGRRQHQAPILDGAVVNQVQPQRSVAVDVVGGHGIDRSASCNH